MFERTTFKVGDTLSALSGICTYDPGTGDVPVNGVGASAEVHVARPYKKPVIVRSVDVDGQGKWAMQWQPGDLDMPGKWKCEVQITFPSGKILTVGPAEFTVEPQIA